VLRAATDLSLHCLQGQMSFEYRQYFSIDTCVTLKILEPYLTLQVTVHDCKFELSKPPSSKSQQSA